MTYTKPNYHLLRPWQMKPPEEMELPSEDTLPPLRRAELDNLRKGDVPYYITLTDTVENRRNFEWWTVLYQQYAHKERWQFKPENWQVKYVAPSDSRFPQDGEERRIYQFKSKDPTSDVREIECKGVVLPLSCQNRLGFQLEANGEYARMMRPSDADDLGAKVIRLFERK